MRELTALASGALDGFHLEQYPPADAALGDEDLDAGEPEEGDAEVPEHPAAEQLVARGGGRRYEAPAKGDLSVTTSMPTRSSTSSMRLHNGAGEASDPAQVVEVLEGLQSARRDDDEHSDDKDGASVVGSSAAAEVDTGG
ncbi:MAG TPA: hypothetical protein VE057_04065, partial [Archangium sp.]|nr:hypothetical protein [Archangium sp.]